jgi:hypothetical protein
LLQHGTRSPLAKLYRTEWKQGTDPSLGTAVITTTNSGLPSTSSPESTSMDVLAAAARYHCLQDGLDSQGSRLDIGPTADAGESRSDDWQNPTVLTSAAQEAYETNHQTYGNNLSSQWHQEVVTTDAASSGQNLMGMTDQFGVRPSFGSQPHEEINSWRPNVVMAPGPHFNGAPVFPLGYDGFVNTSQFLTDEWLGTLHADNDFIGCFQG